MNYRGKTSVTQLKLTSRFVFQVGLHFQPDQWSPAFCKCQGNTPQVCDCYETLVNSLQAQQKAGTSQPLGAFQATGGAGPALT